MEEINWNQLSELGLLIRINRDILHPLGLSLSRNIDTGMSEAILVADDGVWEYAENILEKPDLTEIEIREKLAEMLKLKASVVERKTRLP